MSKLRKKTNFTIVPNELIRDSEISFKAKGVYSYLASQDDGWNFYIKEIASHGKEGIDAVRTALKELEDSGYVKRHRVNGEDGKFHYDYEIYESPHRENPHTVNPVTVKSHTKNTIPLKNNNKRSIDMFAVFSNYPRVERACNVYKDHIKELGAKYKKSETAWKLFISKVGRFIDQYGEDKTTSCIALAIENNWKTIYEPTNVKQFTKNTQQSTPQYGKVRF